MRTTFPDPPFAENFIGRTSLTSYLSFVPNQTSPLPIANPLTTTRLPGGFSVLFNATLLVLRIWSAPHRSFYHTQALVASLSRGIYKITTLHFPRSPDATSARLLKGPWANYMRSRSFFSTSLLHSHNISPRKASSTTTQDCRSRPNHLLPQRHWPRRPEDRLSSLHPTTAR